MPSADMGVRGSWDLNSYIDTSPTMPGHGLAQSTDYKSDLLSPATTQAGGTRGVR